MNQQEKKPLISFIIPVLNEEEDIAKTINPLKRLTWLDKEIIVADGGSTDKTVEVAKNLADKVYIRQPGEKNTSIAENRNKGAGLARGKYLFFMDCGVQIERLDDFVKKVISVMQEKPKSVGITLQVRFHPEEENKVDKLNLWVINKTIKGLNKVKLGIAMGWVQFVKREAFEKIGGYKESLITQEDVDLFRRLSRIGKTVSLKNFVAYGSAQRYHQDGWVRVNIRWLLNWLSYVTTGKSFSKEWKPVDNNTEKKQ